MNMMRRMRYRCLLAGLAVAIVGAPVSSASAAEKEEGAKRLKAAFVRHQDLWVKVGEQERQLTQGERVRNPRWSPDGQWIAYRSGDHGIRLYHLSTQKSYAVGDGANFRWSPTHNRLAFQTGESLQVVDASGAEPQQARNVALGVGNYAWQPDGGGFLVSTTAKLLPDGWSNIHLYTIPLGRDLKPGRAKRFYTLPSQSESFFAVQTGTFKWSADGQWIAFIAAPTASLSADGNTLCVLGANGKSFRPIGEMLFRDEWFQWAPRGNTLAFIAGVGREATVNKKLTVKRAPFRKTSVYTPQGYADREFSWQADRFVTVSRVKESASGTPLNEAPLPVLVRIDTAEAGEKTVTAPPERFGDFYPVYATDSQKLTWIRSDRRTASVWIGGADGSGAREWIAAIDLGSNFYDAWSWNEVLDWYERPL